VGQEFFYKNDAIIINIANFVCISYKKNERF